MEGWAQVSHKVQVDSDPVSPQVVAVASGKGGVGKTIAAFGMAWYLAKIGYRVAVVDLDFGVGNLHLSAGMGRVDRSLDDFLHGRVAALNDVLIPLEGNAKLSILPAAGRRTSRTHISEDRKQVLLEQVRCLDADIVLLDIGAGSSQDNIDYFLNADHQVAVATADLSAITALLVFLKKAQIHRIIEHVCATWPALAVLADGEYSRVSDIYAAIGERLDEVTSRSVVQQALRAYRPAVLLNRVEEKDLAQLERLNKNLMRHVNAAAAVLGTIPEDDAITRCRRRGQNFLEHAAESRAAKSLATITHTWHQSWLHPQRAMGHGAEF